jgi:glycosyltransferase involved in cell wall biosynthesis
MMKTLCVIHEAISNDSAIAKVAMAQVRIALDAGWRVSVVAKYLDESLRDRVEWLPLYVPRRAFAVKWLTARHFIRKAMGNRRFDCVHAHQPQVADLADVFTCHFLTRVAKERNCLETRSGIRPSMIRLQQQMVLKAEDRCYRNWNPPTRMVFCSDLLKKEFSRLYGEPPRQQVLMNSAPAANFATVEQRREARQRLLGRDHDGLVVGYIGGLQERKGYKRLLQSLQSESEITLLMAGQYTQGFTDAYLGARCVGIGLVTDTPTFYAACDCIAVPSLFDPCPLVVFEACSRGTPVIATNGVGNLPALIRFDAGLAWNAGEPIGPLVRKAQDRKDHFRQGMLRLLDELSPEHHGRVLLSIYEQVGAAS